VSLAGAIVRVGVDPAGTYRPNECLLTARRALLRRVPAIVSFLNP
jgi:hypothetical protein